MATTTLTHKDLAERIGVSETTIKSYRRKFPEFFPVHSRGKPIRFKPEAEDVCREIRQCFGQDLSVAETRVRLSARFKVLGAKESLDPARNKPGVPGMAAATQDSPELLAAVVGLRQGLDRFADLQLKANERLDTLQELVADFLTLHVSREDTFSRGLEELRTLWSGQLEALQRNVSSGPRQSPAKRVKVTNAYGGSSEYVLESQGKESEALHQEAPAPPDDLLGLPLVVQSGPQEFFGVAGKSAGHFSLNDFTELLARTHHGGQAFTLSWDKQDQGWQLLARQEQAIRPEDFTLLVQQATTPRGNQVAVLKHYMVKGEEAPPPNLYGYIKQLKDKV